jgi:uncharacterized protein
MNSKLLECRVLHHRRRPKEHRFTNRIFFLALDLSEADALARRLWLFSRNRRNLYAFHDRDFLPAAGSPSSPEIPLLARARQELRRQGIETGETLRVVLVAIPRIAGYLFNPVSFYFCYDEDRPLCALAEVTNTFREVKTFPVPVGPKGDRFEARLPKEFYVSPFSESNGEFVFLLRFDGERLVVRIDEYEAGKLTVHSVVVGESRALTDRRLAWFAIKYPLLGLQVMARIHTQALRLYLKGLPWWRKGDQAHSQRNFTPPPVAIEPVPAGKKT